MKQKDRQKKLPCKKKVLTLNSDMVLSEKLRPETRTYIL